MAADDGVLDHLGAQKLVVDVALPTHDAVELVTVVAAAAEEVDVDVGRELLNLFGAGIESWWPSLESLQRTPFSYLNLFFFFLCRMNFKIARGLGNKSNQSCFSL